MLEGLQTDGAPQRRGPTSLATGLALAGLGLRAVLEGEVLLVLGGIALVRHELGRRGVGLVVRPAPPEGVLLAALLTALESPVSMQVGEGPTPC